MLPNWADRPCSNSHNLVLTHTSLELCDTYLTNKSSAISARPKNDKENDILFYCLFRSTPVAYGTFQARGRIGATFAGLRYSRSNAGAELCL